MSIKVFELFIKSPLEIETKYILVSLATLADDYGRIYDFDHMKLVEVCNLGPRTVIAALDELKRLEVISILDRSYLQLRLPNNRGIYG